MLLNEVKGYLGPMEADEEEQELPSSHPKHTHAHTQSYSLHLTKTRSKNQRQEKESLCQRVSTGAAETDGSLLIFISREDGSI